MGGTAKVQDYLDSKTRYRNDVITFRVIPPPNKNCFHAKLLTLNLCIQIWYLKFSTTTVGTSIST